MGTTYPRVRQLLRDEVLKLGSVNRVSMATGLTNNTIGKYLEGLSEPQQDTLEKLSKYFNKSVVWLRGDDDWHWTDGAKFKPLSTPSGLIPVVSMASANGDGPCWEDAYPVGQGMEMIHRPEGVIDPKAFAVKVDGDSMSPRYENGEIVVVCPHKQVTSGMYVVAKISDGRVMVKRIRYVNDHVLLESINPNYETIFIPKDQLEFAYRIVWKKEG